MRVSSVSLGFLAASLGACATLSQPEGVVWLTGSPTSTWDAVEAPSACSLDAFRFGVRFPGPTYKNQDTFKWQLVAKNVEGWENGAVVSSGPLYDAVVSTEENGQEIAEEQGEEGLKCEFDPEFCTPKLVNIRLPDINPKDDTSSLQKDHSIVLEFKQPTNRPDASSKEELSRFVQFTEYIGDELVGTWSDDGQVLVIRIVDIDKHAVKPVGELMKGLLQTKIIFVKENGTDRDRDGVSLYEGWQNLRIEPPGSYIIRIVILDKVAFWSPEISIVPCDAAFVVLDPSRVASSSSSDLANEILRDTVPSFEINGVLTHGRNEGFVLPHEAIEMEIPGSWSLSFWVFLTEDSTGSFRTLFFNGDGENEQRTPSAWWKPDERRLVLRLTTETNVDVGLDSASEFPLDQWVHMGFTFVDCTQGIKHELCPYNQTSDSAESWLYSYSFYVNGVLDTDVRIHESVITNTGPLHIGKGPWTDGMQGFTSNLRVFPVPISAEEQRKLFYSERQMHKNYANCSDESFAETDAERTATQISYLAQCLDLEEKNFRGSDNENGELFHPDTSAAFFEIQDNAFQQFVSAKNSCEPDAWDYLVEAAELGHSLACRDVGDAHLYGSHEASCSALTPVGQNLILAGKFLRKAFTDRVYSTGKSLALLMALNSSGVADEVNHLDMLTTGLLHFAASSGVKDAFSMLGSRYSASNSSDVEVATYHYYHAAAQAATEYHQLGQQPLHEMTRLFDSFERDVTAGERGDDDELIQFQKLRADQGDTVAMTDMGDLYYWGAHGVSRDHTQAYNYFNRAAQAGNVNAQSAVAGMLLKGEGAARDDLTAIKWYEKASEENHTRALNGLGYIHFHGTGGVEANKTLALEYFERAARNAEDGDSIFNAGYCYAMGLGTNANLSRAMEFYEVASRKFGHFDAIFEMGRMWMLGVPGVMSRNSEKALEYLKAASDNGQWGRSVRKGFDLYTDGQLERAVVLYHEARELGYPVAVSNLAFLYDQRLLQKGNIASEKRALKYLLLAHGENGDRETLVRIGDYHYYGLAGLRKEPKVALRWYSRASAEGDPVGAFNVGQMYEFGDGVEANLKRAQRYYDRSLELSVAAEAEVAIRFAMTRLTIRKWVQNTPFETLLGLESPLETNTSVAGSAAMFDATTNFFYGNVYMIFSTGAVVCVSIGVWYFRSTQ